MTLSIQLLVLAVVASVIYPLLKKESPSMAQLFSVAVAVVCLTVFFAEAQPIFAWLESITTKTSAEGFSALLKATGIIICADYARDLCRESGSESLASCVSIASRFLIIATAMPLLELVYTAILELTA